MLPRPLKDAIGSVAAIALVRPNVCSSTHCVWKLPFSFRPEPVDGQQGLNIQEPDQAGAPAPYIPGPFALGAGRVASSDTASILRFVAVASACNARRCSLVSRAWNASRNSAAFRSIA